MENKIVLYTMTNGLGDYLIMSDVMRKAEKALPQIRCFMVHRQNPHIELWPKDEIKERFYNIYCPIEILRLILRLRAERKKGKVIFGLQMAPGSLQGFFLHSFLKKCGALDYIVDFNLINADIITNPRGDYILDVHLNQIRDLFKVDISQELYRLALPIKPSEGTDTRTRQEKGRIIIGIHPWSRRSYSQCFEWPFKNWVSVIQAAHKDKRCHVVVFGKDKRFGALQDYLRQQSGIDFVRLNFVPNGSVNELIHTIRGLDLIISVNTSVVHIGYALGKSMIMLCGPSLDIWIPKTDTITIIRDEEALFKGVDRAINDVRYATVRRISSLRVQNALDIFLGSHDRC